MNPSAVPSADLVGEGSVEVAMGTHELVILQYALPAVRKPQCRLSLLRGGQSTVKSAMPE